MRRQLKEMMGGSAANIPDVMVWGGRISDEAGKTEAARAYWKPPRFQAPP